MSAAFLAVALGFALVFFATAPAFFFLAFAEVVLLATFSFTTFLTAAFFVPAFRVTAFFCAVFFAGRFFALPAVRALFLGVFFLATFRVTAFFFAERFFALRAARAGFLAAFLATFLPAAGRRVDVLAAALLRDGFGAVFPRVFLTAFFAAIVRASKQISRNGRLYIRLGSEEASGSQKSRR